MGRRRTWRERRPLTWRLATKVSKIVEKKEVCFCSFCFVLRVYEIECFFKRNYTWLEDLVLLLSSLVVIIVVEANLTVWIDGTMVGCYDTPDMWWVITSYFVSPGSVMARKRERERERERGNILSQFEMQILHKSWKDLFSSRCSPSLFWSLGRNPSINLFLQKKSCTSINLKASRRTFEKW